MRAEGFLLFCSYHIPESRTMSRTQQCSTHIWWVIGEWGYHAALREQRPWTEPANSLLILAPTPDGAIRTGSYHSLNQITFLSCFSHLRIKPNYPSCVPPPPPQATRALHVLAPAYLLPLPRASRSTYTGLLRSSDTVPSTSFLPLGPCTCWFPPMHAQPQSPSQGNLSSCSSLLFIGSSISHTQSLMFFSFTLFATVGTFIIYDYLVKDSFPLDHEPHEERDHNFFSILHCTLVSSTYIAKRRCSTNICRVNPLVEWVDWTKKYILDHSRV